MRQSAAVLEIVMDFSGLIAEIPRTRLWCLTHCGRQMMATSLYLRDHPFPNAHPRIAA